MKLNKKYYLTQQTDYYLLAQDLNCGFSLDQKTINKLDTILKENSLVNFYNLYLIRKTYLVPTDEESVQTCERAFEFINSEGASAKNLLESSDVSYAGSGLVLDILSECNLSAQDQERVDAMVANLLQSTYQTLRYQLQFIEGKNHLLTTLRILVSLEKMYRNRPSLNLVYESRVSKLLNYVFENFQYQYSYSPEVCYYYSLMFKAFANYPQFQMKKNSGSFSVKTPMKFAFKMVTVGGQQLNNLAAGNFEFSLLKSGKRIKSTMPAPVKSKSGGWILKLNHTATPVIGELMIRGVYNDKDAMPPIQYNFEEHISITTTVKLELFHFEISEESKTPQFYSNQIDLTKQLPDTNQRKNLNENSYVHIKFKIKFDKFKIQKLQQAFVRLRHPKYKFATHYIAAKYKEDRIEYTATIDLGDPDHILPKSDEYVLEVLVGDQILQDTMTWDVTTFQVNFRSNVQGPPLNDASYTLKEGIEHYFPEPAPNKPVIIPATICSLIVFAIVVFFYVIWDKVGVNMNQVPGSSFMGILFTFLFLVSLLCQGLLFVLFWVELNLLQMLPCLLVLTTVTFVIGNTALNYTQKQKAK